MYACMDVWMYVCMNVRTSVCMCFVHTYNMSVYVFVCVKVHAIGYLWYVETPHVPSLPMTLQRPSECKRGGGNRKGVNWNELEHEPTVNQQCKK